MEYKLKLDLKEIEFNKEKELLQNLFKKFQTDVDKEMEVKQLIQDRQNKYIDVLKKELIIAKNIIKFPRVHNKISQKMNFDEIILYQYGKTPEKRRSVTLKEPFREFQFQEYKEATISTALNMTTKLNQQSIESSFNRDFDNSTSMTDKRGT